MKLKGSVKISAQGVFVNGERRAFTANGEDWKRDLYTDLGIDYSKFYKMDALAKMSFLGFHLLNEHHDLDTYRDDEVAMLFANTFSSYDNDQKYLDSYEVKGSPSPSLFVYTLPNILTGELAIFKKWYGENIFFIQENFDPEFFIDQINFYFSKGAKACLCGWVDAANEKEECLLFFVEKSEGTITEQELLKQYNQ